MTDGLRGAAGKRAPRSACLQAGRAALSRAILGLWLVACGTSPDVIVKTSDGRALRAADIDQDPLSLLPAGAALVSVMDAPALFASPVGGKVLSVLQQRMPLPPEADFVPQRDLETLYWGFYSVQGADFAGVAQGRFNPVAIEAAADGSRLAPLGEPLRAVEYAGRRFYVAGGMGLIVLTERTALFGNETGIRRVLDRLEIGRIQDEMPPSLGALLRSPNAPFALGIDALSSPQLSAFSRVLPWLDGLALGRIVGDFEPPGMNLAGTLSYPDAASAAQGKAQLDAMGERLRSYSWLASVIGLGQPLRALQSAVSESSVQFTASLELAVPMALLDQVAAMGKTP